MKLNEYFQANMDHYNPQLYNDRNKKRASIGNNMQFMRMNASRIISKSVEAPIQPLTTRPTLDFVKNSINLPQIQQLVVENQVLWLELLFINNTSKIKRRIKQNLTCNQQIEWNQTIQLYLHLYYSFMIQFRFNKMLEFDIYKTIIFLKFLILMIINYSIQTTKLKLKKMSQIQHYMSICSL